MSVVCVVGERKGAFLWWWVFTDILFTEIVSSANSLKYETFLARIPVLGSHSSAWITLQCSDYQYLDHFPVLG
ncbi:hypothetical protein Anas_13593 [Armadillidium nasatum]|uniref:Uncharacterized protein n=1 Tax=Armadillidium nasatum TaxID=96803 RepID=A0A5N5T8T5_9CRUS|nr:hypothetical protein Anas_13593 [Armadillidium nasatum]